MPLFRLHTTYWVPVSFLCITPKPHYSSSTPAPSVRKGLQLRFLSGFSPTVTKRGWTPLSVTVLEGQVQWTQDCGALPLPLGTVYASLVSKGEEFVT